MWHLMKKFKKELSDTHKKEKVLEKLVHAKEDKGYDAKECRFVDKTIGEEYYMCFPFGHQPILDVTILAERFKQSLPNIVYKSVSNNHVDEIKRQIA
jgi:hypothetical protein